MAKHVIELNGQKYDATTGKPVVSSHAKPAKHQSAAQNLDGFTRRPTAAKSLHTKTQKSQTLMRKAVKKPVAPAKIHAKTVAPTAAQQQTKPEPRLEVSKPGRVIRAHAISQSGLISKFGKQPAVIHSEVVPVKPAPTDKPAARTAAALKQSPQLKTVTAQPKPEKKDVFQAAIENAQGHASPKLRKAKVHHRIAKKLRISPRLVTFSGAALAILAVSSVFAYQNMPEIAMKIASTRAGLNASLPAYQPAGFALAGPIQYDTGEVTLNYRSNTDERAFNVIQKNSSWNSETLLENFVETNEQPYQTFQANGRTIYIYDGNKATWVDGGVWYNIDGQTNLNSDQLLKIAESL